MGNTNRIGKYLWAHRSDIQGQKTCTWTITGRSGGVLGLVKWYSPWRQYCFYPNALTTFSTGCLEDLKDFLAHCKGIRQ